MVYSRKKNNGEYEWPLNELLRAAQLFIYD
jgi:hypothetical protein